MPTNSRKGLPMRFLPAFIGTILLSAVAHANAAKNWVSVWADTLNNAPSVALDKDKGAHASWRKIVPEIYQQTSWISELFGNAGETKIVSESGHIYALGSVCKPHDCYNNGVAFLIEPGGGHAAGALLLIRPDNTASEIYFGDATPLEHEWLRERLLAGHGGR